MYFRAPMSVPNRFILLSFFLLSFSVGSNAQSSVDSLLQKLPTAQGEKRIEILLLLCDELSYVDADSARNFGLQASSLIEDKTSVQYAQALYQIAITHQVQSNYNEALRYDAEALQIFKALNDDLKEADILNNIGLIYDEQGMYKEAIDYYRQAYQIYKQSNKDEKMAVVALNLGVVFKGISDYENSLVNYKNAQSIFSILDNQYGVAVCNVNMGSVFLATFAYDSALKYSLLAEEMFRALHYKRFEAVAIGNAGIAFGKLNQKERGIEYLNRAIALHQQNSTRKELSYCYLKLAELYVERGQPDQGLSYAKMALEYSKAAGVLQQVADTHKLLATIYSKTNRYREAFAAEQSFAAAHDSLFQLDKVKYVREFQVKYETEKKERELAEANVKITAQELKVQERNNQLTMAAAVILFIAVGALVIFRNQQVKQQRLRLKAQLAEAQTLNAIQDERLRISQELHDNIGSQLTFVKASLEALEKTGLDNQFTDIKKLTASAIQELRKTVWLINKQSATVEEFTIKLREYIPENSIPPISITSEGSLDTEIQSNVANQLFRVIQEAVNNVIKHANATIIQADITVTPTQLSMRITDNGIGFDTTIPTHGFGLRNIQKRIKSVNGTVTIQSKPKETTVTITIPL